MRGKPVMGRVLSALMVTLVAGFLLAVLRPAAPAVAGTWSQEATGGFGNADNMFAWSSAVFNSKLFVGTVNLASGLEIYSYDGETWSQEVGGGAPGTPTGPGFGNAINVAAACMAVYGPHLYVGTGTNAGTCEVWRFDGESWSPVVGGGAAVPAGFGNPTNTNAYSMAVYGNELFVGTSNSTSGCEVWRFDGESWSPVVGGASPVSAGFNNIDNTNASSMAVYGEHLYVATSNIVDGSEIWRFDGAGWSPVVGGTAIMPSGFGSADTVNVGEMVAYGGLLFTGADNSSTGCELWSFDGSGWEQLVGALPSALLGSGFGDPSNEYLSGLGVYDSRLFASIGGIPGAGCEVWSYDLQDFTQEVGGGAAGSPEGPGFGDPTNLLAQGMSVFNNRLYIGTLCDASGCQVWSLSSSTTWYLAEGATSGNFETWILVQNPNPDPVHVTMTFQTDTGLKDGPTDTIPGNTRRSYLLDNFVDSYDVSTTVKADGDIICERSMYWMPPGIAVHNVGHDSMGVTNPASTWYLAEGATAGGFETWVLVQNPNPDPVNLDIKFQTSDGEMQGPQDTLDAYSRISYRVNEYVETYDVSTQVNSYMGNVICERTVYYTPLGTNVAELGHNSIGVTAPSSTWYLAEGATAGGFETWVLVQNPNPDPVAVNIKFQTGGGEVQGPVDTIPERSRRTYRVNDYVQTFDVSTLVSSTGGGHVICERAVYWRPAPDVYRILGTDSIGYRP